MPVCDYECFNCPHPDCIASGEAILKHENQGNLIQKRISHKEPTGIGKLVFDCRTQEGLSQRGLAAVLGLSSTAVGSWEIGKHLPSTETWDKLVEHYPTLAKYRSMYDKEMAH